MALVATQSIPSPNAEDTKHLKLLKPPTKAQLKECAAKEKETLEVKRTEAEMINAPVTDIPGTQSKPRHKPRPKHYSEVEIAALNAVINRNIVDDGPLLPAGAKIFMMPDPQAEDVVPSHHNLTAEGRCQQEEKAEREMKRKACSQREDTRQEKPKTKRLKSRR